MKKNNNEGLDFEIDQLTNSIRNVVTGDSFSTDVILVSKPDLKSVSKKSGWQFDWAFEYKQPERDIYKLTITNNQNIIQGMISLEVKTDHVYMHLIESAPFNLGKHKMYDGVSGNLVAFACRTSFQRGFGGAVSFLSKSKLISHYIEKLGAFHIGGRVMVIEREAALKLINKYYPQ